MGSEENKRAVFRCVDLFNQDTLEWADVSYSRDVVWTEVPGPLFPKGRSGGWSEFRAAAARRLRFLPDQKLRVLHAAAEDGTVIFIQEWGGTAAAAAGGIKAGDRVSALIVTFFRLKDGLIVEHADYPIAGAGALCSEPGSRDTVRETEDR